MNEPYFREVELLSPGMYEGTVEGVSWSEVRTIGQITLPPRLVFFTVAIVVIGSDTTSINFGWTAVDPSLVLDGEDDISVSVGSFAPGNEAVGVPYGKAVYEDPILCLEPCPIEITYQVGVQGEPAGAHIPPLDVRHAVARFRT